MSGAHAAPAPATVEAIVQVAMDEEAQPFLDRADSVSEPVDVGRSRQYRIVLAGHDVLLVRSGIGLVNAAGAATAAILRVTAGGGSPLIISAGSAGGLGAEVRVGDVIVGLQHLQSDADARAFGYALGQVPGMPERYDAAAAAHLPFDAVHLPDGSELVVRRGLVVSSDSFVDEGRVDAVRAAFPGALATDMESAAIAQTAHVHGLAAVAVRGISDLCGPEEFDTHVDDAALRSAVVVEALLAAV